MKPLDHEGEKRKNGKRERGKGQVIVPQPSEHQSDALLTEMKHTGRKLWVIWMVKVASIV